MQEVSDNLSISSDESDQVSDQVSNQVSNQVMSLLFWLKDKQAQKLSVILEGLLLKHRPTFKKNYLNPALDAKWVAMTAPDSPKSPQQKYFLTALGKKIILNNNC